MHVGKRRVMPRVVTQRLEKSLAPDDTSEPLAAIGRRSRGLARMGTMWRPHSGPSRPAVLAGRPRAAPFPVQLQSAMVPPTLEWDLLAWEIPWVEKWSRGTFPGSGGHV